MMMSDVQLMPEGTCKPALIWPQTATEAYPVRSCEKPSAGSQFLPRFPDITGIPVILGWTWMACFHPVQLAYSTEVAPLTLEMVCDPANFWPYSAEQTSPYIAVALKAYNALCVLNGFQNPLRKAATMGFKAVLELYNSDIYFDCWARAYDTFDGISFKSETQCLDGMGSGSTDVPYFVRRLEYGEGFAVLQWAAAQVYFGFGMKSDPYPPPSPMTIAALPDDACMAQEMVYSWGAKVWFYILAAVSITLFIWAFSIVIRQRARSLETRYIVVFEGLLACPLRAFVLICSPFGQASEEVSVGVKASLQFLPDGFSACSSLAVAYLWARIVTRKTQQTLLTRILFLFTLSPLLIIVVIQVVQQQNITNAISWMGEATPFSPPGYDTMNDATADAINYINRGYTALRVIVLAVNVFVFVLFCASNGAAVASLKKAAQVASGSNNQISKLLRIMTAQVAVMIFYLIGLGCIIQRHTFIDARYGAGNVLGAFMSEIGDPLLQSF